MRNGKRTVTPSAELEVVRIEAQARASEDYAGNKKTMSFYA